MSRAAFEPVGRSSAYENLVAAAELRGMRVRGAKWPHEAEQWGGMVKIIGSDGTHWATAATVADALGMVRSVKVRYD